MYETAEVKEKYILVGVDTGVEDTEKSLEELSELVETAGALTAAKVIQPRESIHPGTYVGKGKLEELREMILELGANGIVCDDELSPAQYKNIEDILNVKVMDRTLVILDIFAQRAVTSEGKIQVELAQLKYRSSRLVGMRNLSRQGGSASGVGGGVGIGSRGPGEKKLEIDRRLIRNRISQLKSEVEDMKSHRDITRGNRRKKGIPVVAIVGYTNAGKSTLLNTITDAEVLEEDKLFATLDPTTRSHILEDGQEVLMTDTVGFIRKLPHHLIDAFRSTLEEALFADIIIHMVDASNPQMDLQIEAVYKTLDELGVKDKPVITVFNKIDKLENDAELAQNNRLIDNRGDYTLKASVKEKIGLSELDSVLSHILNESQVYIEKLFTYNDAGKIATIRKYGKLLKEEYQADGIYVEAYMPKEYSNMF